MSQVLKTGKGCYYKNEEYILHFSHGRARLNAYSRDCLNDPDYITIEIENNNIIISPSNNNNDWKVTKERGVRLIAACAIERIFGEITNKTKLYGKYEKNKLIFTLT